MNPRWFVVLVLLLSFLGNFPGGLTAAQAAEEKKTNLLDNDDLAKALAELGDDMPASSHSEKMPETPVSGMSDPEPKPSVEIQPETEILKQDQDTDFKAPSLSYVMMEHLSEADALMTSVESEISIKGVWSKGNLVFPGQNETEIRAEKVNLFDEEKLAISVKLSPKHVYRLRFNRVPPFSKIKLQYKLQEPPSSKVLNYMYFKVFVGKYELRRLQVSSKDSWRSAVINVGAVSFLNHDVPVFFEFATNQASGLTFSFIPETQ